MAKKSPKNPERGKKKKNPTRKQAKYAEGIANGKTKRRAATDAGYSQAVADKAARDIEASRGFRENFAAAIRAAIPIERIVEKLSEGIDATHDVVVVTGRKGQEKVDVRQTVDFRERREYLKVAAVMGQYHNDKLEIAGAKDIDVHVHLVGA